MALYEGNPAVTNGSPPQGPVARSFDVAPEQMVEQTIETPVTWEAIALIVTSL